MTMRFDRLPAEAGLFMQVWAQTFLTSLEGALDDLASVNDAQSEIIAELAAQLALIQAAQDTADAARSLAGAVMSDIAPVTVNADYTGAVLDGELPLNIACKRFQEGANVTTTSLWSLSLVSGDGVATIGDATGIVSITALDASSVWEVSSERDDNTLTRALKVEKVLSDPPPSSGTGTSSAYDSSILSSTTDAYGSANAGPMTLTCGASGEVQLSAPLTFKAATGSPDGSYGARGLWQYRPSGGGSWTDAGTEALSSTPATIEDPLRLAGSVTINRSVTGLTPASDYEFQLLLRGATGDATLHYSGKASAVTS